MAKYWFMSYVSKNTMDDAKCFGSSIVYHRHPIAKIKEWNDAQLVRMFCLLSYAELSKEEADNIGVFDVEV